MASLLIRQSWSRQVKECLRSNYLAIKSPFCATRLWETVFKSSDRKKLGDDFEKAFADYGTIGMWVRLFGVSEIRALIDIAEKWRLNDSTQHQWLLRETGESVDNPNDIVERIAPIADLLMIERTRQVYWKGRQIAIDWVKYDSLWSYLWELARRSKRGESLDRLEFSAKFAKDYLTKTKSRLTRRKGFPADFADSIVLAGRHTQRLDLSPQRIRLYMIESVETVCEWTGGSP